MHQLISRKLYMLEAKRCLGRYVVALLRTLEI